MVGLLFFRVGKFPSALLLEFRPFYLSINANPRLTRYYQYVIYACECRFFTRRREVTRNILIEIMESHQEFCRMI